MNCPSCGHTNPDEYSFCEQCGASLAATRKCSACGHDNPSEYSFCENCGNPLVEERKCAACGHENPADYKYCEQCGASLDDKAKRKARVPEAGDGALLARKAAGGLLRLVVGTLIGVVIGTALQFGITYALTNDSGRPLSVEEATPIVQEYVFEHYPTLAFVEPEVQVIVEDGEQAYVFDYIWEYSSGPVGVRVGIDPETRHVWEIDYVDMR